MARTPRRGSLVHGTMAISHPRKVTLAVGTLVLATLGLVLLKVRALGYSLADVLPLTQYRVGYQLSLDGHGGEVSVRTFLPVNDARQRVSEEQDSAPGMRLTQQADGPNRVAIWSSPEAPDGMRIRHAFSVVPQRVRFRVDPSLEVPATYPPAVAALLRPEKAVQVDAPEIRSALERMGAHQGTAVQRLERIYRATASLTARPFKGTTDALTALRLGEASCNGKSRLFAALARAAGIPARLVGGLILDPGSKRTSHQWVEAYLAGHWVPFCPTNRHFAELPERYLPLYYGDQSLFRHTADVNFDYRFEVSSSMVPSPRAKASFKLFDVWGLFERLNLPFTLLRTILMLPVGALVVVIFRNVVGMPTFGTFLPALIAAAATQTGALWGVVGVLVVVAVVSTTRWVVQRLELLHSPSLAILLAAVTLTLLTTSLVAERLDLVKLAHLTLFPIAVMAISAERFYLSLAEHGARQAAAELGGTILVMLACYLVMQSVALHVLVVGFPEVLLLVVAADVVLGRWVGMRLSEYGRFRGLLFPRAGP